MKYFPNEANFLNEDLHRIKMYPELLSILIEAYDMGYFHDAEMNLKVKTLIKKANGEV